MLSQAPDSTPESLKPKPYVSYNILKLFSKFYLCVY